MVQSTGLCFRTEQNIGMITGKKKQQSGKTIKTAHALVDTIQRPITEEMPKA